MFEKKIVVISGGNGSEREISLKTGRAIYEAIKDICDASLVEFSEFSELLLNKLFLESDLVFPALHGWGGEDGRVQGMMDLMGKKYVGSGVGASSLFMDKHLSKLIAKSLNIPTPKWLLVSKENFEDVDSIKEIGFPLVLKPVFEGSSVGLAICSNAEGYKKEVVGLLQKYDTLMAEEFIGGREFTYGILCGLPLPLVEIKPKSGIYDYASKYTKGLTEYICPASAGEEIDKKMACDTQKLAQNCGLKGVFRADYKVNERGHFFLEVNTIPGMTETSLVPKAASCLGVSFKDICVRLISETFDGKVDF